MDFVEAAPQVMAFGLRAKALEAQNPLWVMDFTFWEYRALEP